MGTSRDQHAVRIRERGCREGNAVRSRCRDPDFAHAGRAGRDRGHEGRAGERVAARGHIATGALDRHCDMAGSAARDRHGDVGKRGALGAREARDARGHAFQRIALGIRSESSAFRSAPRSSIERVAGLSLAETLGEPPERGFAACPNLLDQLRGGRQRLRGHRFGARRQLIGAAKGKQPHVVSFAAIARRRTRPARRASSPVTPASDPPRATTAVSAK